MGENKEQKTSLRLYTMNPSRCPISLQCDEIKKIEWQMTESYRKYDRLKEVAADVDGI